MDYWIFIATAHKINGEEYSPEGILATRLDDGFWGLGEQTPNRRHLKKEDQVVFYLGNPHKQFSGIATLGSDSFQLTQDQQLKFGHDSQFYTSEFGVMLENQVKWNRPIPAELIIDQLDFIENKEYWFSYFQGGVRKLSEHDFRVIIDTRDIPLSERIRAEDDIESESEFALEAHLEEFIDANWSHIRFPFKLRRYQAEDQSGRQYPAGQWSIDFLCEDEDSGEFVVIELKRGKTSDATVGQVLRYMGWVEENLCDDGQSVKGIIISRDVDDALRYAIRGLPNVTVMTYKVDFELRTVN